MKLKERKRRVDSAKIREDYGTIKRACKLKGVNYNTYKVWAAGFGKSKRLDEVFREYLVNKGAA